MGFIDISVGVMAIAFVMLVVYLIKTLNSVRSSLEQANESLVHMQKTIDEVSKETTILIQNTNRLTLDLQEKSQSFDSIFHSVDHMGQALNQITTSIKQISTTFTDRVQHTIHQTEKHHDKVNEVVRYMSLGLQFWKSWQARKEKVRHIQDHTAHKDNEE